MAEFTKDYVNMFKQWGDFAGKTKRGEFWMAYLVHFIVGILLGVVGTIIGTNVLASVYGLVALIPMIAMGVRRFHDIGKSGLNWLWIFLPFIGWIIVIVLWVKE